MTINKRQMEVNSISLKMLFAFFINTLLAGVTAAQTSNLAEFGHYNGSDNTAMSCVRLVDSEGNVKITAKGKKQTYAVNFTTTPGDSSNEIQFNISAATRVVTENCNGVYRAGLYTDSILFVSPDDDLNGKIFSVSLSLKSLKDLSFTLDTGSESFVVERDLDQNSVSLGSNLGSFDVDSIATFNTVNVPYFYSLIAPQCVDNEGDEAMVVIENNGEGAGIVEPGSMFSLATDDFIEGAYEIRAYCSDGANESSESLLSDYAANSPYASGSVHFTVMAEAGCVQKIDFFMENLNNNFPENVPSWDELACYTGSLTRQPNPDFFVGVSDRPPSTTEESAPAPFFETIQNSIDYFDDWPQANAQLLVLGEVPPYLLDKNDFYDEEEWDYKLRGMATYGIYLKYLGKRVSGSFFYPPHFFEQGFGIFPVMNSREDFLQWWEDVYIPERVSIAEMSELIQAEYYQPWDIEPGQTLRAHGDLWLEDLSDNEQVELAQQAIDMLYDAIRPVFSGTLIITNYDRYAAVGNHWQALDLSAWDQVQFSLYTEGDVEGTEFYLQEQLSAYLSIVERDGLNNWVLQEITVDGDKHQLLLNQTEPIVQFQDIEADIYQVLFDAVENLSIAPNGIGITTGYIETSVAENLVAEKLAELAQ